jgi:hypothetical protein
VRERPRSDRLDSAYSFIRRALLSEAVSANVLENIPRCNAALAQQPRTYALQFSVNAMHGVGKSYEMLRSLAVASEPEAPRQLPSLLPDGTVPITVAPRPVPRVRHVPIALICPLLAARSPHLCLSEPANYRPRRVPESVWVC